MTDQAEPEGLTVLDSTDRTRTPLYGRDKENIRHFANLMGLPVDRPGRMKLRDAVPYSPRTLATKCRSLTSPVMAFGPPRKGDRLGEVPTYADWCRSVGCKPVRMKRSKVQMFEESPAESWRDYPQS